MEENTQNMEYADAKKQPEKSFIDSLKDYNDENMKKDIYVPSLGRSIKFSLLSTKQQRYIIESSLDNPIYNATFHTKTYQIIKELAEEKALIDSLNVFDKDAILIQLRYHYIDKTFEDKDYSGLLDNIKNFSPPNTVKTSNVDGFTISFKVPSIKEDNATYRDFKRSSLYKVAPDGDDDVRSMVATMYILELSKYVSTIVIDNHDAKVNFSEIELEKRIEIIDNLGKKIANAIQDFINEIREQHEPIYKVDDDTSIEITPELFS